MLTTTGLGYWYGPEDEYLFRDVSLDFQAGSTYAIVGKSGSGKTTMVSLLAGLDKPKAGTIAYEGKDIAALGLTNYRRKYVSIVFQAYNLFNYMSATENLMTAMAITDSSHKGDKSFAEGMLRKLGLTDEQMRHNVQRLSGGQQQRVAIARSMVCDAPVVVADEPTGNLDETNTQEVIDLFNELAHEQHKCVIIVTHEADVAAECDGVIRLAKREISWERQPATQPATNQ